MWRSCSFYEEFFPGDNLSRRYFFLDSKLRDKKARKIKILRNPKTSTQNKTSNSPVSSNFNA